MRKTKCFSAKSFTVSIWSQTWVVPRQPSGCREGLRKKPDTRRVQRGPSKASGFHKLLVMLENKPFEETLTQPSLGASQPVEVTQVSPIFLTSFTCSSRTWFSRKSELRACAGSTQGLQSQKGLVQVLLQGHNGSHSVLSVSPLVVGRLLPVLERRCGHRAGFAALRDAGLPCASPWPTLRRGPRPPEPHR